MKEIIGAFATDNGKDFIDRHFGDAEKYLLYRINSSGYELIDTIENHVVEEDEDSEHSDSKKAGGIAALLKSKAVKLTAAPVYGPNLKRIKKKFVCILVKNKSIEQALITIQGNLKRISEEWEKGEGRDFLKL